LTPFGGLAEIDLLPGETVIIAPATGRFGGGAVTSALAMGATVVACGRNESALAALKHTFDHTSRLETVTLTGNVDFDTAAMISASHNKGKGADAYLDFSPQAAARSTHIAAAMAALKPFGRACFGGGIYGNIEINYLYLMLKSLRIQGRLMYSRDMIVRFIKMVEKGNLKLGEKATGMRTVGKFGLDQIQEAIELASKEQGWGKQVLLMP
jgi:D-arabinose 1-dehydrogenase-like Zn-dependent alcohol dehydrogenase